MPSHSERVRRNYDPEDSAAEREQPPDTPEWGDEAPQPIAAGHPPQIPPRDEDDSNAAGQKPC